MYICIQRKYIKNMQLQQSTSALTNIQNRKFTNITKQNTIKNTQNRQFIHRYCTKQDNKQHNQHKINVALVSDFYYPFVGGVQIHIKQLATLLSKHSKIGKIIVITHKYQYHSSNLYIGKRNYHDFDVYYLNIHYNKQQMIMYPTFIFNFRTAAKILRDQRIDIVHCHQTGSTLALQFIFYSRILGIRVIITQHSLYGFRSFADIHFNRVTKLFVPFCDKVIAVSKTTRNNIILRAGLRPEQVVVIPNGVSNVEHLKNKPKKTQYSIIKNKKTRIIKIISVGRMTFRRGTDLLIQILPELCRQHTDIQILIAGDGIKRPALQKIIQMYNLHHQVRLLGIIADHEKLLQKMAQCDIFLNTPLTQSFGIALTQAAMLGLLCVSTNVGGIQQAIPAESLYPAQITPKSLNNVLRTVIQKIRKQQKIQKVGEAFQYPWAAVCERTIQLYQILISRPKKSRKFYLIKAAKTYNILQGFFALLACFIGLVYLLPFC